MNINIFLKYAEYFRKTFFFVQFNVRVMKN